MSDRTESPLSRSARRESRNAGRSRAGAVSEGRRGSCFQSAITFSTNVVSAAPWITWIRRISLNLPSSAPKASALPTIPTSDMT